MAADKKSLRDISRANIVLNDNGNIYDSDNCNQGSLQRIADALEKQVAPVDTLKMEIAGWKTAYQQLSDENKQERRNHAATKRRTTREIKSLKTKVSDLNIELRNAKSEAPYNTISALKLSVDKALQDLRECRLVQDSPNWKKVGAALQRLLHQQNILKDL